MNYFRLKKETTVTMLTGELKTLFAGELLTCAELEKMYNKITLDSFLRIKKESDFITIPKSKVYFSFGVRKQII